MKQGRGQLTERIKVKSKELFGYEITQAELRLMPYIQYVMCNEHRIDPSKINKEERAIISAWKSRGYIKEGYSSGAGLIITKDFWDMLNEIIYLGYVDINL